MGDDPSPKENTLIICNYNMGMSKKRIQNAWCFETWLSGPTETTSVNPETSWDISMSLQTWLDSPSSWPPHKKCAALCGCHFELSSQPWMHWSPRHSCEAFCWTSARPLRSKSLSHSHERPPSTRVPVPSLGPFLQSILPGLVQAMVGTCLACGVCKRTIFDVACAFIHRQRFSNPDPALKHQ